MLTLARRNIPPSALRPPQCPLAVAPFSTSLVWHARGSAAKRRARLLRAPPPHPPDPPARREPTHAPIPHLATPAAPSNVFQTRTRWLAQALSAGTVIPRDFLYKVLASRSIPPAHLALWIRVLTQKDPIYALQELGLLESAGGAELGQVDGSGGGEERPPCPDWLYLALPGLVSKPEHVPYLASQLFSPRFAQLDEQNRGLFVARCMEHFLKVRHYVALREMVEWVAFTPAPSSAASSRSFPPSPSPDKLPPPTGLSSPRSFARLLTALSSERIRYTSASATPPSVLQPLASLLTRTMAARAVPRTLETFLPLFSNALIPREPREAFELLGEMQAAGHAPGTVVLHALTNVCARKREDKAVRELLGVIAEIRRGGKTLVQELGAEEERGEAATPLDEAREMQLVSAEEAEGPAGDSGAANAAFAAAGDTEPAVDKRNAGDEQYLVEAAPLSSSNPSPPSPAVQSRPLEAPSSLPVRYTSTALLAPSHILPYYHRLAAYIARRGRPSQFPAPPFPFDRPAWVTFFAVLGRSTDTSPSSILDILHRVEKAAATQIARRESLVAAAEAAVEGADVEVRDAPSTAARYTPPPPTLQLYTAVLRSLLLRHAPRQALRLWRALSGRGWHPDAALLDCLVRAYAAVRAPDLARQTLDFYAFVPSRDAAHLRVSSRAKNPDPAAGKRPNSVRLDAVPVNSLLKAYSHAGRFSEAYELFKAMEEHYGVKQDAASVSIILDAARFASARAGRGFGPPGLDDLATLSPGGSLAATVQSQERADADTGREEAHDGEPDFGGHGDASPAVPANVDDRWDGIPAARRMEDFVWREVLEANWQDGVADGRIEDPLRFRERGGASVGGWLADKFSLPSSASPFAAPAGAVEPAPTSPSQRAKDDPPLPPPHWRPFASTLSPTPPTQPHIPATDPLFRSLIQLVGQHSRIRTIPLLLGWMKALHVRPSRWTLGLALMYVDGEAGISDREKRRMREWCVDWLGAKDVPDEREIAWIRRGGRREGVPELR
ncbi:hypothetical protein JCM10213_006776 [Rhodosporidiobolus nylandii]